jgi:hypothetical protein
MFQVTIAAQIYDIDINIEVPSFQFHSQIYERPILYCLRLVIITVSDALLSFRYAMLTSARSLYLRRRTPS